MGPGGAPLSWDKSTSQALLVDIDLLILLRDPRGLSLPWAVLPVLAVPSPPPCLCLRVGWEVFGVLTGTQGPRSSCWMCLLFSQALGFDTGNAL